MHGLCINFGLNPWIFMPFVYFYAKNKIYAENIHKSFCARDSSPPHSLSTAPSMGTWLWLGFDSARWRRLFATQSAYHANLPNLSIFSTHPIYLIVGRVGMMGTLPIMTIIGILGKLPRMALFQHFQGFLGLFSIGNDKCLVYSIRLVILLEAHLSL